MAAGEGNRQALDADEVARRLRVYDDLVEFAASYEWAHADGGEYVMDEVRDILNRDKEA